MPPPPPDWDVGEAARAYHRTAATRAGIGARSVGGVGGVGRSGGRWWSWWSRRWWCLGAAGAGVCVGLTTKAHAVELVREGEHDLAGGSIDGAVDEGGRTGSHSCSSRRRRRTGRRRSRRRRRPRSLSRWGGARCSRCRAGTGRRRRACSFHLVLREAARGGGGAAGVLDLAARLDADGLGPAARRQDRGREHHAEADEEEQGVAEPSRGEHAGGLAWGSRAPAQNAAHIPVRAARGSRALARAADAG
jgi:hypothetical protein